MEIVISPSTNSTKILENVSLKKHTTLGVGGKSKFMAFPESIEEIQSCMHFAKNKNIPWFVMGCGSNLLVSEKGFSGLIINISSTLQSIVKNEHSIFAETGISLRKFVQFCSENRCIGMEKLIGIPGTLGGALKMNAGAYGQEIANHLSTVTTINHHGIIQTCKAKDLQFGYRQSPFSNSEIVVNATFSFPNENLQIIQQNMNEVLSKRKSSQPLNLRSSGCIFKNPKDDAAGRLIDAAELKGTQIGGAMISHKHANFFLNTGDATADDFFMLIELTQKIVCEKFGVKLCLEVVPLGDTDKRIAN